MEEADTLCSRIGIMAAGQLQCIGSPQHLKIRHGSGFKLTLSLLATTPPEEVDEFVLARITSQAKLVTAFGLVRTYTLPSASVTISQIFNRMETEKYAIGVVDWAFNQASLEEVFVKIAEDSEAAQAGVRAGNPAYGT